ncbi:MAG: glycosyltransferase family 39 protein [Stappiaceae bacterium]
MTTEQSLGGSGKAVFYYVGALLIFWSVVPSLLFANPPLDVVEGYVWGHEMALGYTKHPPLQAWLLEFSNRLTGGFLFGAYFLSQFCIGLTYLFIWKTVRDLGFDKVRAFWSVVLTSLVFFFTFPTPEFNPNTLQMPIWAGMVYLFHRGLTLNRLIYWVLLGGLAALGLYTKYFVLLLIGTIGLYLLIVRGARPFLMRPGPWIAGVTAIILFVPHILWMFDTDFLTLRYAAERSRSPESLLDHLLNPLNFLVAQIGNHGPMFLVILSGFGLAGIRRFRSKQSSIEKNTPSKTEPVAKGERTFLFWFSLLPIALLVAASMVTGNHFEHMWGAPLFFLSGPLAVLILGLPENWTFPKNAFLVAVFLQIVLGVVLIGQAVVEPYLRGKGTRLHYPGAEIARAIEADWHRQTDAPLTIVAGDMWTAANVSLYSGSRPSLLLYHDFDQSPWIDPLRAKENGLLVVWRGKDRAEKTQPGYLKQLYPDIPITGSRTFDFQTGANVEPVTVGWLIIPPNMVNLPTK